MVVFSWNIYLLGNSWRRIGGASRCKHQNACWWHLKHLSPVASHSKTAIAMKESKCSVSLCLITYQGNAEQENRCHSHGPRSPSEWDNKSCSRGRPHATFAPPDVQRRPAKYKKIFSPIHITLEFFQEGPETQTTKILSAVPAVSSCGVMLCINQCRFPCIFSSKVQ